MKLPLVRHGWFAGLRLGRQRLRVGHWELSRLPYLKGFLIKKLGKALRHRHC